MGTDCHCLHPRSFLLGLRVRRAPVSPKSARTPYQNSPWKQKDAPKLPKEKRLSKDTPAERLEPRKPEAPVVKPQARCVAFVLTSVEKLPY